MKLEDEYVTNILEGGNLDNFPSEKLNSQINPDVRAIMNSFTASVIFKLLFV